MAYGRKSYGGKKSMRKPMRRRKKGK